MRTLDLLQKVENKKVRGATITLIKDDTTEKRRHVWANINGKTFAHLIENETEI